MPALDSPLHLFPLQLQPPPPLLASASLPPARLPLPRPGEPFCTRNITCSEPTAPGEGSAPRPAKPSPLWFWLLLFSGATSHTLLSLLQTFARARSSFLLASCPSLYFSHKSQLRLTSSLKPSLNGSPEVWVRAPQVPGTHPLCPPPCPDGWLRWTLTRAGHVLDAYTASLLPGSGQSKVNPCVAMQQTGASYVRPLYKGGGGGVGSDCSKAPAG